MLQINSNSIIIKTSIIINQIIHFNNIVEQSLMNLTARIKSAKQKPNYVLNVNINFPLRSPHVDSHRPVSGEFSFSPTQPNKKIKLQIPSARTTNECESRKFSYLGQTQNTMSFRHNNRKKTVKSAFPSGHISQLFNPAKKSKTQIRSQAVSPNKKKMTGKISKNTSSVQIPNNKLFVNELINESEDNIIAYTSQSSQFEKNRKVQKNQPQFSSNILKSHIKYKSESPLLEEQKGIIYEIREFQKTAQIKKQHLNYQYLKEKVLLLASVKKIQRAWRNYKTKKIINSYSNNFSLKFTGKMKNQVFSAHDNDQGKILTVRSCGFNGKGSQLLKQGKKNLSQLYLKDQNIQEMEQQQINDTQSKNEIEDEKKNISNKKKLKNIKEGTVKSAIVKFQMEEISKWDELIKNIKQGKKIDEVLQKSFRRKLELEKQLSNNLKDVSSSDNSEISRKFKQLQHQPVPIEIKTVEEVNKNLDIFISEQVSMSSQNSEDEISKKSSPIVLKKQKKQKTINIKSQQQQEGPTTQRRRKKLQYFQNQLRKIDNQYSESNLSQSYKSQSSVQILSPEFCKNSNNLQKNSEQSENIRLKRKLQAFNRVHMFSQERTQSKQSQQEFKQANYLFTYSQESPKNIELERKEKQEDGYFLPLSLNKKQLQLSSGNNKNVDRLDTFRKTEDNRVFYEQLQNQRLQQLKRVKLSAEKKLDLVKKIEEELFYDILLELSENQKLVNKIEKLYSNTKEKEQKPEGICTNLQSIKDYLQNFVAFAFQQQTLSLIQGFNQPKGPSPKTLLNHFNQKRDRKETNFHISVLSTALFNKHWEYASEQIYFDAKYPNDPVKEQERVRHLKQITKMYFGAIFDGFNECLQPFRIYGREGKPFPWKLNIKINNEKLDLHEIKPLIRLGYRKLSQIAVIYCGLLFEDKKHNMSQKMIDQIQKQRLDTLVELQLQDQQHKWIGNQIQSAEVLLKVSEKIYSQIISEMCWQLELINLAYAQGSRK